MNKLQTIFLILIISFFSCKKNKDLHDNPDKALTINYNHNAIFQVSDLPDGSAIYDTVNHVASISFNAGVSCYDRVEMKICLNLDSIRYPFVFPKKTVVAHDYLYGSTVTNSQCASLMFYKIIPPDSNISDFEMISADKNCNFYLFNYSGNNLIGAFYGSLYCIFKHPTCEYIPVEPTISDTMVVNMASFNVKLKRK